MVDYHTREKISHSGKRISPEMKSKNITECGHLTKHPQLKTVCFLLLYWMPDFEFLLESVNQWDTLCTYHYLNKATTTFVLSFQQAIFS
jgi:hypothetical protein